MSTPSNVVIRPGWGKLEGRGEDNRPDLVKFLQYASADEIRLFVGYVKEKDPHNSLIPLFDMLILTVDKEERLRARSLS